MPWRTMSKNKLQIQTKMKSKQRWVFPSPLDLTLSSLKDPKDMFDAMNGMYKDDLENSTQGCEGAMSENIQWLLQKKISSQGEIRSHWRQWQWSRCIIYNFERSPKFSRDNFPSRNITYEEMHDWLKKRWQSIPNNPGQEEEGRTFPPRIEGHLKTQ